MQRSRYISTRIRIYLYVALLAVAVHTPCVIVIRETCVRLLSTNMCRTYGQKEVNIQQESEAGNELVW